jgi:putative aldouronate transport system permease protein
MKKSRGEIIFNVVNNLFMLLVGCMAIFPVINILARSLSSIEMVAGGEVYLFPKGFNLRGWKYVLNQTNFLVCLRNSVIITSCGTVLGLAITTLTAYALSHKELVGRHLIIGLYVFFMIFSAGIVPDYFQIKEYGLLNTYGALIFPCLLNPYYMFVLKSNFEHIPSSLEEAARIDGASWTQTFWTVILPVAKAAEATIVVFISVSYWNRYFDALMYITRGDRKPITLFLYEFIKLAQPGEGLGDLDLMATVSPDIMHASAVILTVLPIVAVYPFLQRYFVKGMLVGSVKG